MSTTAKHVFDELTFEDLLPMLRQTHVIRATHNYHTTVYTSWQLRKEYVTTDPDGDTVTENYDNPEIVLYNEDKEGPHFDTADKIKVKNGKISARTLFGMEYELELFERINVDQKLMDWVDTAETT